MFALIGSIIGLLSSGIPEILKYFRQKSDQKHEEKMLALQVQHAETMKTMEIDKEKYIADIGADVEEAKTLKDRTTFQASGSRKTDAFLAIFNGTVRPFIAYAFTGLYGLIKWASYSLATKMMDPQAAILTLWTDVDSGIFSTVIFFFFGQRAFRYTFGKVSK